MDLNGWMMKFLEIDNPIAEAIGQVIASIIRKDESRLKCLYAKLVK